MGNKKKIALVIGWGSVKCVAALGLLRVLKQENIEIDLVVASGGGSIYGALFALGYDVDEIVEMNKRLWTHEVTEQTNRLAIFQILFPRLFKVQEYFNLRNDDLVNQKLEEAFGGRTFSDTKIPLFISATNYQTGDQVVLSEGSIYEAVRATIALPLIFPPLRKGDQLLADGYLSEPLPIGVAIQEETEIILAMGFETTSHANRDSFSEYILHLSGILSNNLLSASYSFYNLAHHSDLILIVPQFEEEIHMFDTEKVPEIIKVGEDEGYKILPELKSLLLRSTG
jgi:NTE family protein